MTRLMHFTKPTAVVLFLSCLFAVAFATGAEAQQLSVTAVNASMSVAPDGTAQATFSIKVTNNERSPMTNFFVTFKDGTTATLPDVPAQDSVVSDPQTRFVDLSQNASVNIPIPVTLTYNLDGNPVEISWGIVLTRP